MMANPLFSSCSIDEGSRRLALGWLLLAVLSLVFAGMFAFLLVMSRTPFIQDFFASGSFIYTALVVHVDLALVIWFLAFCGVLLSLSFSAFRSAPLSAIPLGWAGLSLASSGTLLLIITAFIKGAVPSLNNYIPVLQSRVYYAGLILIAAGVFCTLVLALYNAAGTEGANPYPEVCLSQTAFGMGTFSLTVMIAFCCFVLAYKFLPGDLSGKPYFERLFWGGGHILQASNTIGMLCTWILLTRLTAGELPIPDRAVKFFFAASVFLLLPGPWIYFKMDILSGAHKKSFVFIMLWAHAPAVVLIGFGILGAVLSALRRQGKNLWAEPGFSALVFSMILFAVGGIIGFLIIGSDVRVPSHYHGMIGAVTLAFMGLSYYLLPLLNREVACPRLARIQPWLYGLGQILFVLGLYTAGTHGVPRKTYGQAQNLNQYVKVVGMTVMGIGGLVAISGGISYLVNMLFSLFREGKRKAAG